MRYDCLRDSLKVVVLQPERFTPSNHPENTHTISFSAPCHSKSEEMNVGGANVVRGVDLCD
jgi:hypothetical protein